MASFSYTALDVNGKKSEGNIDAMDVSSASTALREQGLFVVNIGETRGLKKASEKKGVRHFIANNRSVSKVDLVFFFKQMAFMLRAGLPMLHALNISKKQFKGRLGIVIADMVEDVETGKPLSAAMMKYKTDVFPPIVANMVLAGENTGGLDAVMLRLATHLEKKQRLKSQTVSAMVYPSIVILVAIAVVAFLLGVIIPKFAAFLSGRGKRLPEVTQLLIDMSEFVVSNALYIIAFIVLVLISIGLTYATTKGRLVIDTFLLKIPVLGKLLTNSAMADFNWSLSMMLRSGLTAFDGLKTSSKVVGNRYISRHLSSAAEKIKVGKDLASSIEGKGIPDLVPQMTTVGEQTGALDHILEELGGFYEERLEEGVKRMASLIEPTLILTIGLIVGFVYYAFFSALFALAK